MISILIPTYNYNAFPLAKIIESQALKNGITYELICIDDGSFSELNKQNQQINTLTNSKFIESTKNIGSKNNREKLAKIAQYEWLLFIDADCKPKANSYLSNYLKETSNSFDVIFGGFAYDSELNYPNKALRFTFGKHREEVDASIRNSNPYKVTISANFLIKRDIFLSLNNENLINIYGLDYLFGSQLKQHDIKVKHINNEVLHLGLDNNDKFLEKTRNAVQALLYIYQTKKVKTHDISLLRAYSFLKSTRLRKLVYWLFNKFESKIKANLIGSKPNLILFDLYRLGYLCKISLIKKPI